MSGSAEKADICVNAKGLGSCSRVLSCGQVERIPGGVQNRIPGGLQINNMPRARPVNMCGNVRMRVKRHEVPKVRPGSEVRVGCAGKAQRAARPLSCIEGAKQKERYRSCRYDPVGIVLSLNIHLIGPYLHLYSAGISTASMSSSFGACMEPDVRTIL